MSLLRFSQRTKISLNIPFLNVAWLKTLPNRFSPSPPSASPAICAADWYRNDFRTYVKRDVRRIVNVKNRALDRILSAVRDRLSDALSASFLPPAMQTAVSGPRLLPPLPPLTKSLAPSARHAPQGWADSSVPQSGTSSPMSSSSRMAHSSPASAAARNHFAATTSLCSTPSPNWYRRPRWYCASQ